MPNNNIIKIILPFLFVLLLPFLGIAQDTTIVKLRAALDTVKTDLRRVDVWVELATKTSEFSIDSAKAYLEKAEQLATDINYTYGLADVAQTQGSIHAMEGEYAPALRRLGKAQTMFRTLGDSLKLAKTYMLLGNVYNATNSNNEAHRYYRNAESLFEGLQDYKSLAGIHNNIGIMHWSSGRLDSASMFFNKALLTFMEFGDKESLTAIYTNLGVIYAEKNDLGKAIEYYEKSNETLVKLNQNYGQAINNLNISDAYLNLKSYDNARAYIGKSIEIASREGYKSLMADQYYTVGEIEEASGNFKEALTWYQKSEAMEDSLFDSDTNAAMMEVQTKQLEEIKEREIEKINQINEVSLKAEKLKNTLLLLLASFVLVLLLVATLYFYKRAKVARQINTQNLQILNQKSKIYEQAKSIADKNEELLEKNLKLEGLNEEKNYIMNVVAHDLKSPLNQIQGLSEIIKLEKGLLSTSQLECLDNISTSSERLSGMINRILDTRAIESENKDYLASNVKVIPLMHDIIGNFQPLADQKGIAISAKNMRGSHLVKGDKHHIQQVIENIVSNAIKFSPRNKKIEINLKKESDQLILSFKDEGPGLTKEDHEQLFIEYANLSAKPTGNETSTGLGLSIVKKYVELMNGRIWCESTEGKGATFYLAFNLA